MILIFNRCSQFKIATQKAVVFVLCLVFFAQLYGQQVPETANDKKNERKSRPTYWDIGAGIGYSDYRDAATSPLIYNGICAAILISRLKFDLKRESKVGLVFSNGVFISNLSENLSLASVTMFSLYYSKLYQLTKFSDNNWNTKLGGVVDATGYFRINKSFQNNSLGSESFGGLFGAIKVERDVSRNEIKERKILFIKRTKKPKKRSLSYQLNVGAVNSTFRNGYAYIGQSSVLNNEIFFDNYQFKVFSGMRLYTALNYTIYLSNKNAVQWSYQWSVASTGGKFDKFEIAAHIIKFSLLFNTK